MTVAARIVSCATNEIRVRLAKPIRAATVMERFLERWLFHSQRTQSHSPNPPPAAGGTGAWSDTRASLHGRASNASRRGTGEASRPVPQALRRDAQPSYRP